LRRNKIIILFLVLLTIFTISSSIFAAEDFSNIYKSLTLKIMKSNVQNKTKLQNEIFDLIYENKNLLTKDDLAEIIAQKEVANYKNSLQELIRETKKKHEMTESEIRKYNSIKQQVFRDFFINPDYSDPKIFLGHGEQSKITEITYSFVEDINDKKDFSTLAQIFQKLSNFGQFDENIHKLELYSRYKTEDYIKDKKLYGCTSYGLVIANMARAKGIPAVFVEGLKMDFIREYQNGDFNNTIRGHVFIEVYIDNKWYLIDSTRGRLYTNYNIRSKILPNNNYLLGKGIDRWDFGMKMKEYFKKGSGFFNMVDNIKLDSYSIPNYEYLDLRTMTSFDSNFREEIAGVKLAGKIIYYFDAGQKDNKFREILQDNVKRTDHGFIYNYLRNYAQYKEEADILILSGSINYFSLPDEIRARLSKEEYENLPKTFNLFKVDKADIIIIKTK